VIRVSPASPIDAGTKGSQSAIGLRWLGLGVSAFVIQIALVHGLAAAPSGARWLPFLLPTAHLLLIPFLIRNLKYWGMRLLLAGLLLNLTAMLANGGLMPVEPSAVQAVGRVELNELKPGEHIPGSKNRLVADGELRASWLSDRLIIPVPRPFTRAVSIGDIIVAFGVVIAYGEVVFRRGARGGISNA
jgi:hypothetical protein